MKNSLPNVQPMVISAPAKREVSLRQRVTQDYLSEHEFLLENATITYSTIQNKSI